MFRAGQRVVLVCVSANEKKAYAEEVESVENGRVRLIGYGTTFDAKTGLSPACALEIVELV